MDWSSQVNERHRPVEDDLDLRRHLTIVLLTYNCGHRIDPILDRLAALDVPTVAVDNASSDNTVEVLVKRPWIQIERLDRNIGAAARNVGAQNAKTPYVAFCDDDGWYERAGLIEACRALNAHPTLAVVNAKILVTEREYLDPISHEMSESPLADRHGIPGAVLLSFMAGAVVVRVAAYSQVGGYDTPFFIGGEEETLAFKLAKAGWEMRYRPEVVMHHFPSVANASALRALGMRNTLWNAWLHRRFLSAARWTIFTLLDTPKNGDWCRGVWMALRGAAWVAQHRAPMSRELDAAVMLLDKRRFARRRPVRTRRH
jgi:GT2 family glycosyltransferase